MITKEKILTILFENSSYLDSSLGNVITEEKHNIIADEILKTLDDSSVCPKCKSKNMSDGTGGIGTCFDCHHIWKAAL